MGRCHSRGGQRVAVGAVALRSKVLEQNVISVWRQQLLDTRAAHLCSRQLLLKAAVSSAGVEASSRPSHQLLPAVDGDAFGQNPAVLRQAFVLWRWCVVLDW